MIIREMEERDLPEVCALMHQLSGYPLTLDDMRGRWDMVKNSPIDWIYVCEIDGTIQGAMGFRLREQVERPSRYAEISALVTHADARRKGVGRALVDFAEQLAREHHCIGTWLVSGFGRKDEAHVFYENLGYKTTGYRFVKLFDQ
jgi:GNAT superfamily N-acetyltransferase